MHAKRNQKPPSKLVTSVECDPALSPEILIRSLLSLDAGRRVSILDSNGARPPDARYLIAGFDPLEIVEARGARLTITQRGVEGAQVTVGSGLDLLDARLANFSVTTADPNDQRLPVAGACIASFAYDFAWQLESCLRRATHRSPIEISNHETSRESEPDAVLAFYDTLVVHDYATNQTCTVGGQERAEEMRAELETLALKDAAQPKHDDHAFARHGASGASSPLENQARVVSNFTRDEYISAVRRIREHIFAGDIYQANLTQQFTCSLAPDATPEEIFLRLRRDHPASFAAFLRRRADTVISQSPERFLRVSFDGSGARTVEAWPIKGTRPRGETRAEDARLCRDLETSEKDRAENVMIVDLLRNDLGRVCRYGSIEVPALCRVQEHPTLFHLVSEVRGTLRDEITAGDLLRATFPCGSITGAPKLRAMEIIDEIEIAPRGLSMGAIGYFSFDGQIDLNVAIRTMTVSRDRTARFNTGGGIVADSCAEEEYAESLTKARSLVSALEADFDMIKRE